MLFSRRGSSLYSYLTAPILVVILAVVAHAPLGDAATGADFGQYGAHVSWYTWPLHSMMGAFEKISPNLGWIGSVGVPTLCAVGLLLLSGSARRFPIAW